MLYFGNLLFLEEIHGVTYFGIYSSDESLKEVALFSLNNSVCRAKIVRKILAAQMTFL